MNKIPIYENTILFYEHPIHTSYINQIYMIQLVEIVYSDDYKTYKLQLSYNPKYLNSLEGFKKRYRHNDKYYSYNTSFYIHDIKSIISRKEYKDKNYMLKIANRLKEKLDKKITLYKILVKFSKYESKFDYD